MSACCIDLECLRCSDDGGGGSGVCCLEYDYACADSDSRDSGTRDVVNRVKSTSGGDFGILCFSNTLTY